MQLIQKQYQNIITAERSVQLLYQDPAKGIVSENVSRVQYEEVKAQVYNLPQKDIVEKLNPFLVRVLQEIERREYEIEQERIRKEQERIRQIEEERRRIEAAYVILSNVPYINQVDAHVYNGCEVDCLLMGLQYRGYLKNVSLIQIANDIPKHESNAYEGFVGSIFELQPKDYPHWVSPSFLASFGRNYAAYQNVVDITGSSSDKLKEEINAGNPVIIYGTYNFAAPKNQGYEVPNNIHVLLLIGYNQITGNYVLYDPWNKGKVVIQKGSFESIYEQVGRKAVVIR